MVQVHGVAVTNCSVFSSKFVHRLRTGVDAERLGRYYTVAPAPPELELPKRLGAFDSFPRFVIPAKCILLYMPLTLHCLRFD